MPTDRGIAGRGFGHPSCRHSVNTSADQCSSYKAANWQLVGRTVGRGKKLVAGILDEGLQRITGL